MINFWFQFLLFQILNWRHIGGGLVTQIKTDVTGKEVSVKGEDEIDEER